MVKLLLLARNKWSNGWKTQSIIGGCAESVGCDVAITADRIIATEHSSLMINYGESVRIGEPSDRFDDYLFE